MADLILSNGKNVVDILSQLKKIKKLSIKNLNLLYLEGVILFIDAMDDVRL